jgi:hypothetical protein
MADDLHEVVKLLLARMESHPDEFASDLSVSVGESRADRWWQAIRLVNDCGTKKEKDAINQGIRKIKLQRAHEMMMDELLNGDERRRKEEEEQEYERTMMQQVGAKKKIVMTHAEMDIINKLTETSTLAEKEQFIREYAKSKQEMRK